MEFDFLMPVNPEIIDFVGGLSTQHIGSKVAFHTESDFPDLGKIKLAIIGVLESRGNGNHAPEVDLTRFRKEFYGLFPGNWEASIADLGDIAGGESLADTYYAVQKACEGLLKRQIVPMVIGGCQDLTYAMYRAYDRQEQMVNLTAVDSRFDFGKGDEKALPGQSYLTRIILDEPNNLFNFTNVGYQTYYNSQEEIDLVDKLYFDAYRIGEMAQQISLAEPVFRDTDLVSVDLSAAMSAASGNFRPFVPNGFNGREMCALTRYAGISDKVSSFGVFGQDLTTGEAALAAQLFWYFIEGVHYRSNEYPFGDKSSYLKYIVAGEDEELVFYKSDKTSRWWIEIPSPSGANTKLKRTTLLPCSYEEYLAACDHEIPERWWKAQRKNLIG